MVGKNLLVAIIDGGITSGLFSIDALKFDVYVTRFRLVCNKSIIQTSASLHGSVVAGIIKKYAPKADICSIQIFKDSTMRTSCRMLVSAMKWCLKMNIPIINLSLGTIDPDDFKIVNKITDKLLENGQIIVAACKRDGSYGLPAMHPGVIGVRIDTKLSGNAFLAVNNGGGINYAASSIHELDWPYGGKYITPISNSYAAPTITAAVINGQIGTNPHCRVIKSM